MAKSSSKSRKTAIATNDPDSRYCIDCGTPFVFGDEERRFYAERGFKEPDRCLDCRASRRAERNADLIRAHESQSKDRWVEALGHYGGGLNGQRNETVRRSVSYPAICASCGKETAVPFVPRHGRPVYCSSCYGSRRGRQ